MASQEKYNLQERLLQADENQKGTHSLLGRSMIGYPQYVNSMRSVMYSSHTQQLVTQENPTFPGLFTGGENVVGKYSSGYKEVVNDCTVYRKIVKFGDIVDTPTIYTLFVFDEVEKRFDVITRTPGESLVENYGYRYKTDVIDSFNEGDMIPAGTIPYRSTSYDEYMNYAFGRDVDVVYTLDPFTSEDAATASDTLADEFVTSKFDDVRINLNDNDFPLNLFGDDDDYKIMPDIGEDTGGIVMALRRKFNNQVFHDFKNELLSRITETDAKFYLEGTVTDITIYCNNEDLPHNTFMKQIWRYYKSQTKYFKQIKRTCEEIFRSGSAYTPNLDYLYDRACKMVDTKKDWQSKESVFSNLQIHIQCTRKEGLTLGQKISARMGNKSVIAKVVPAETMPYYYNSEGKKVHAQLKISLLGIINRTTAMPIFEIATNFIGRKCQEQMKLLKTLDEKRDLVFDVLRSFNENEYIIMKDKYDGKSQEDKEFFIWYCENVKIHFNQPPIEDDSLAPIFYRLAAMIDKYDWIKAEKTYVYKWGREIPCICDSYIGSMYIIELKQTSKRGYSARNMGSINHKGLPARSNKSKSHLDKDSSTAIRFGETENLTFGIGMMPEEVVLINAFYRTSPKAMEDLAKAIIRNKSVIEFDKVYDSRVAEFLHIRLKSLGFELKFLDSDDDLREFDNDEIDTFNTEDGGTLLCTAYEKFLYDRRKEIEQEILEQYGILDEELLNELVKDTIEEREYLVGDVDLNKPFFTGCVEKPEGSVQTTEDILKSLSEIHDRSLVEPLDA